MMPARPEIKEARFRQNALCLGTFVKGQLVGYIWFCFGSYEEDEVRCTYVLVNPNQSVFDFDLYILPERMKDRRASSCSMGGTMPRARQSAGSPPAATWLAGRST